MNGSLTATGPGAGGVLQAKELAHARRHPPHIERILRGGDARDDGAALRNDDGRAREVRVGEIDAQHLEMRRLAVRKQVERAADQSGVGHFVVEAGDAAPRRSAFRKRRHRRGVDRELALVAVADDTERVRGPRRRDDDRRCERVGDDVRAHTRSEDRAIGVCIGADHVCVHAALQVLVRPRRVGREFWQAVVEEKVVVGPRRRAEIGAVDRAAHFLAGRDLEHAQHAFLGTAGDAPYATYLLSGEGAK
jgi:hypothetical protein